MRYYLAASQAEEGSESTGWSMVVPVMEKECIRAEGLCGCHTSHVIWPHSTGLVMQKENDTPLGDSVFSPRASPA